MLLFQRNTAVFRGQPHLLLLWPAGDLHPGEASPAAPGERTSPHSRPTRLGKG